MLFNKHNYEVLGNHSDNLASHVYDRDGVEVEGTNLSESVDCANTFDDLDLLELSHFFLLLNNCLSSDVSVDFWNVVA